MKKIKILLALCLTILMFSECKKKSDSSAATGNTKISSNSFSASTWTYSSPSYYTNLSVADLTSSNINSSSIMVYFTTGGNWFALPYTQYNSPYNYYMGFSTSAGNVQVTWVYDSSLSTGSDPNTYFGTTVRFKVVILSPALKKANPNLDLNNYEEVKKQFNLQD